MRFLIPLISLLFFYTPFFSQEDTKEFETIFKKNNNGKTEHGFYGAFNVGYTSTNEENSIIIGGKGAWIIDHHIAIGLSGEGFSNSINKSQEKENGSLSGGYGGFFIEPIVAPNSPIHISFPILFGAGGAVVQTSNFWSVNNYEFDSFLVFEPGFDLEMNVVEFFRIAIGTTYRITNGIVFNNLKKSENPPLHALDGVNFKIRFKFGKF